MTEATQIARKELNDEFERQFRLKVLEDRLLKQKKLGSRRSLIEAEQVKTNRNITQILGISKVCYETPTNCWEAKQEKFAIEPVDESVFQPPTFQSLCSSGSNLASDPALFTTITSLKDLSMNDDCIEVEKHLRTINVFNLKFGEKNSPYEFDLRTLSTFNQIISLTADGMKLSDLSGLGDLVNMRRIKLPNNHITDLEPLSDMVDLIYVDLSNNLIKDVQPLSGFLRLQWLFLQGNKLTDLSPLTFFPRLLIADFRLNPLAPDTGKVFQKAMPAGATIVY